MGGVSLVDYLRTADLHVMLVSYLRDELLGPFSFSQLSPVLHKHPQELGKWIYQATQQSSCCV